MNTCFILHLLYEIRRLSSVSDSFASKQSVQRSDDEYGWNANLFGPQPSKPLLANKAQNIIQKRRSTMNMRPAITKKRPSTMPAGAMKRPGIIPAQLDAPAPGQHHRHCAWTFTIRCAAPADYFDAH
jgi:hypothetical protein